MGFAEVTRRRESARSAAFEVIFLGKVEKLSEDESATEYGGYNLERTIGEHVMK